MENNYIATAKIFKALCDENRVRIIELLQSGEKCACMLLEELNVTQPTLSHHMKILCDSGFVESRRDGKWTHYSLSSKGIENAKDILIKLTADKLSDNKNNCC